MKQFALATFKDEPNLFHDEAPLIPAFKKRNIRAVPVIWNSPIVAWSEFDVVIIRNTWDYHQQPQAFLTWLANLERLNIPVINPPDLMRWNMDKRYLKALSDIRIVPTIFCEDDSINLGRILQKHQWEQVVVKPIISASGENTWQVSIDTAEAFQQDFQRVITQFGAMIQPFMPQIVEGEWSFVFFNGDYSHTVLKIPPQDSMFTHEERGATLQLIEPAPTLIEQAKKVIEASYGITGIMPAYARVDGILDNKNFMLMELECVEPELYFSRCDGAAERFVDVILQQLNV